MIEAVDTRPIKKVLTVLAQKDKKDYTMDELDSIMKNIGTIQFSYDTFKKAYDTDPGVKKLVKNFDQDKITLSSGNATDDLPAGEPDTDNTVGAMAQRATDLG